MQIKRLKKQLNYIKKIGLLNIENLDDFLHIIISKTDFFHIIISKTDNHFINNSCYDNENSQLRPKF